MCVLQCCVYADKCVCEYCSAVSMLGAVLQCCVYADKCVCGVLCAVSMLGAVFVCMLTSVCGVL